MVPDTVVVFFGSWLKFDFLQVLEAQGIPLMDIEGMLHQVLNERLGRYKDGRCTHSLA